MSKNMDFIHRMLGGRPMKLEQVGFVDVVEGIVVCYWVDTIGRRWMATNKWALFRVPLFEEEVKDDV